MTRSFFEAEAARAQAEAARAQAEAVRAQAVAGDAYDNEAFLEHYSGLAPLDQNWNDTVDSDETQPPSPPPPPPQATTTAAPQDAGMS